MSRNSKFNLEGNSEASISDARFLKFPGSDENCSHRSNKLNNTAAKESDPLTLLNSFREIKLRENYAKLFTPFEASRATLRKRFARSSRLISHPVYPVYASRGKHERALGNSAYTQLHSERRIICNEWLCGVQAEGDLRRDTLALHQSLSVRRLAGMGSHAREHQ